jgi:hypothetical protein
MVVVCRSRADVALIALSRRAPLAARCSSRRSASGSRDKMQKESSSLSCAAFKGKARA